MRSLIVLSITACLVALAGCDRAPAERSRAAETRCAGMPVGVEADVVEVDNGVDIVLRTAGERRSEVIDYARMLVDMHKMQNDMGMSHMILPSRDASLRETTDGAVVTFRASGAAGLDDLRAAARRHAEMIRSGHCPTSS